MIDKVAVGDKLVVSAGYGRPRRIVTVTKITPSGQLSCDDGSRFTSRGRLVGSEGWSAIYAHPATAEAIIEVREERERYALRGKIDDLARRCDWTKAPIEKVRAYAAALRMAEEETEKMTADDGQHGEGI